MYSSFLIIDCHYLYNCDMAGTVTFLFLSFPCIEWSCLHWIEMTIICYLVVSNLNELKFGHISLNNNSKRGYDWIPIASQ